MRADYGRAGALTGVVAACYGSGLPVSMRRAVALTLALAVTSACAAKRQAVVATPPAPVAATPSEPPVQPPPDPVSEALAVAERAFEAGRRALDDGHLSDARLARLLREVITAAYASGTYAAASGPLRWVVDPAEGGCPDCEDNVLAGATDKGTVFPTGQQHPPAHAGCRCAVVPAS